MTHQGQALIINNIMPYAGAKQSVRAILSKLTNEELVGITVQDSLLVTNSKPDHLNIFIVDNYDARESFKIALHENSFHIICESNLCPVHAVKSSIRMSRDSEGFFRDPANVILPSITKKLELEIFKETERATLLQKISDFIVGQSASLNAQESAQIISTELLMNVQKDAPLYFSNAYGPAALEERMAQGVLGSFICAANSDHLLLCAKDYFGSLDLDKMLGRLIETTSSDYARIDANSETEAGLGCRIIYEHAATFIVGVNIQNWSLVAATVPLKASRKQRELIPKNLHFVRFGGQWRRGWDSNPRAP
ncbi:MAG: hypothetical protein N2578_00685 [Bdellovibrionaceae bacterium]|nr:hypothetical protein [Pseudobdellovibrionaceae bacterium]